LDNSMSQEVTNHLFQEPGKKWGLDLAALNIQRGREHGIPSYNVWRDWCGFPKIQRFEDLAGIMSNQTIHGYKKYYDSPDDIDLWSAGIAEATSRVNGWAYVCLHHRQAIPQFQTWRSILVRKWWLAIQLHA